MRADWHWYWHRLRAMSPAEMLGHARKRIRQFSDARRDFDWARWPLDVACAEYPRLPAAEGAPEAVRLALGQERDRLLAGRWRAFGHLEIRVDDPPRWHCDYLAGLDLATGKSAFKLNHRALPAGADIKLIWELSRWHGLVRLAQAAHVLADERAAEKCLLWLADWVQHNPPFRGWNWTSALEAGMRLIQFTWIDALLAGRAEAWGYGAELETLRYEILPAHAWFTWGHRSFGSSANNHLLGELAGLVVATARWPRLAEWGAPMPELVRRWEREVLAQFAPDGGNCEQALNYHLFSWELCWHSRVAAHRAGYEIKPEVSERLARAARFYAEVQAPTEPWDYGDSDDALVLPLIREERTAAGEWRQWLVEPELGPALDYWLGHDRKALRFEPAPPPAATGCWQVHPDSGLAMGRAGDWLLRFDLSPLGYLKTAAHGHLDALHLSIWKAGRALVVDPGTGAYFGDRDLRRWLASRSAHNGPCPTGEEFPRRLGPFLWAEHHPTPMRAEGEPREESLRGRLRLPAGQFERSVRLAAQGGAVEVQDGWAGEARPGFAVRWQFAPGTAATRVGERRFRVGREGEELEVQVSDSWAEVNLVTASDEARQIEPDRRLAGAVSPAFRATAWAPYLRLSARPGEKPCVFTTTFLAWTAS